MATNEIIVQLFECNHCGNPVYFQNNRGEACSSSLGYNPNTGAMVSLVVEEDQLRDTVTHEVFRYCHNKRYDTCNWLVLDAVNEALCIACSLNRTIPDITNPEYKLRWQKIEAAKHRLVYALLRWKLPLKSKQDDEQEGLAFDFKADYNAGKRVLTGHSNGLITINIEEADDVEREMAKNNMAEVYRTVLGHFRHEVGHYYWDLLIAKNDNLLSEFRTLFGDERADYQEALNNHYKNGVPHNWSEYYISAYATMHAWEDWAESWAHYLHIVDTLETAYSFGLSLTPIVKDEKHAFTTQLDFDPYLEKSFTVIFDHWLPVSFALNSINRSMGHNDLYPFVINSEAKQKMAFIHRVIHYDAHKKLQ